MSPSRLVLYLQAMAHLPTPISSPIRAKLLPLADRSHFAPGVLLI